MGRRATFTQSELERAMRAAARHGLVAVQTRLGIAFVTLDDLPQTAPEESDEVDTCAGKFGRPR